NVTGVQTCALPIYLNIIFSFLVFSFLLPWTCKIHHWFLLLLGDVRNVQGSRGNLAWFCEWPTFFQGDLLEGAVLLFLFQSAKYRWLGKCGALLSHGLNAVPYFLFL